MSRVLYLNKRNEIHRIGCAWIVVELEIVERDGERKVALLVVCVDICRFWCFVKAKVDLSVNAKIVSDGCAYKNYDK